MATSTEPAPAPDGPDPTEARRARLTTRWVEIRARKGDLDGIALDDADIALRNVPGGDHVH